MAKDGLDAIVFYERNIEEVVALVIDWEMPRLDGCC
jgi:hypothetical protein